MNERNSAHAESRVVEMGGERRIERTSVPEIREIENGHRDPHCTDMISQAAHSRARMDVLLNARPAK